MKKYMKLTALAALAAFCATPTNAGVGEDLASPVTTPARTHLIVGTLLTLTLVALEDQIVDPTQRETVEDRPLGRFSRFGDLAGQAIPNAAYAGGMLLAGAFGNKNGYQRATMMTFATLYSAGVTTVLKYTVREPRPHNGADRTSFPSGHATTAFAFASVVGAEHGYGWGIPAYALASLVAYSRMNDNKHYIHDVVAGATIGTAYGLGIYYLRRGSRGDSRVSFAPIWDHDVKGASVAYRF